MKRFKRDIRLIPLVLIATVCLFALKVSGLVFDGGYTLGERLAGANRSDLTPTTADTIPDVTPIIMAGNRPPGAQPGSPPSSQSNSQSWAREMFNFGDVTGSVGGKEPEKPKEAAKDSKDAKESKDKDAKDNDGKDKAAKAPADPPKSSGGQLVALEPGRLLPAGERAILERLQDRREQLDARGRDLEMRENLLKAAEKRVEARVAELRDLEGRIKSATDQRDADEQKRFKGIVDMYESMKPKDAARILDRLDLKILVDVTTQIAPRKMAEILAQMSPEAAERLTVELASRASSQKTGTIDALPKIEGRPATP